MADKQSVCNNGKNCAFFGWHIWIIWRWTITFILQYNSVILLKKCFGGNFSFYLIFSSIIINMPDMVVGVYIRWGTEIHCTLKKKLLLYATTIKIHPSNWAMISGELEVLEDSQMTTILCLNWLWEELIKLKVSIPCWKCTTTTVRRIQAHTSVTDSVIWIPHIQCCCGFRDWLR